jgi:hypothetical protein
LPLQHPFVIWGVLYNTFTHEYVEDADITFKFESGTVVTVTTEEDGFFQIDIQQYANDGEDIHIESAYESWYAHHIYKVDIYDLSYYVQVNLDTALANLKIQYGEGEDEYIFCWCSNWIIRNQDFTITTTLNKTQMEYLKDNCVPGAFASRKIIGYGYMIYDTTFSNGNTFTFIPFPTSKSNLHNMRRETDGIIKNIAIAPVPNQKLYVVRIECITKTF